MAFNEFASFYGGGISAVGANDTDRLVKALAAGSGAGLSSSGGRSLVLQDLERTLRITTFGEAQFAKSLFARLKMRAEEATAIMHEFVQLTDYGETGPFSPEISTINPVDVSLQRGYAQIRFMRTKRQVSTVMHFTRTIDSAEAAQVMGGTRFLLAQTNAYLFDGNNAMSTDEWNGIYATVSNNTSVNHVVDLGGAQLTATNLTDAAEALAQQGSYGVATDMWMPLEVQASLDLTLIGNQQRIMLPAADAQLLPNAYANVPGGVTNAMMYGMPAAGYRTSYGNIMFNPNVFTRFRNHPYTIPTGNSGAGSNSATSLTAPNAPTIGAVAGGTGGIAPAGAYGYYVTAETSSGESAISNLSSATITAGQTVTLTITPSGAGQSAYRIYKTVTGGSTTSLSNFYMIDRIVANGSTAVVYTDNYQSIPNTSKVYFLDLSSPGELQSLGWAQLAPMSREELPRGDTFYQWLQFLYGALVVYAPNKIFCYKNVAGA